jgi:hypothetical protein
VKFAARILGADSLARRFEVLGDSLVEPALKAASDALAREVERARDAEGLSGPLLRERSARRVSLGVADPVAVARELGTLDQAPAPWLAPVLPAARGPMRAAVRTRLRAAVRALSLARLR